MGGVWSRGKCRLEEVMYMTCGVGGVQRQSACWWLRVRQRNGRYDSDRMRMKRRAGGQTDRAAESERVDDKV